LWSTNWEDFKDYRPFVNAEGKTYPLTPCPQDERLWLDYMAPRISQLAQLAPEAIVIDLEMYRAYPDVHFTSACYCEQCMKAFRADRGMPSASVGGARAAVVADARLSREFLAWQTKRIASYARRLRDQTVPRSVPLGAFHLDYSAFLGRPIPVYDGLAQGLGTPGVPALSFTEMVYAGHTGKQESWQSYLPKARRHFEDIGASVVEVPGLNLASFAPRDFQTLLVAYAQAADGYWIYTPDDLDDDSKTELKGPKAEYWQAIRRGNEDLDRHPRQGK
jgi:hypothetical protein